MTTIEFTKKKDFKKIKYSLTATGHAGYAQVGQDIVCSAISILLFTLANALDDFGAADLKVSLEPGESEISCTATWADEEIHSFFKFVMEGLELLEEQYPDHVEILEE